jgi:hypothetical protein
MAAAASDLDFAPRELATSFEHQTDNKVVLSFGSSGNFFSQIQNGAPYEIRISADTAYPFGARTWLLKFFVSFCLPEKLELVYVYVSSVLWLRSGCFVGCWRNGTLVVIRCLSLLSFDS